MMKKVVLTSFRPTTTSIIKTPSVLDVVPGKIFHIHVGYNHIFQNFNQLIKGYKLHNTEQLNH